MLKLFAAALLTIASSAQAQGAPVELKGHYIGESIEQLLQAEPEAQQELDVCKAHPTRTTCDRLIAAIERGQRAEISTSTGMDFVLDQGKLVKVTMLLHDTTAQASQLLTAKLGSSPSDTAQTKQNASGAKWENHLLVWNTSQIYVSLYQDNNPSLQGAQPLLVAETQIERSLDEAELAKQTKELASKNTKP